MNEQIEKRSSFRILESIKLLYEQLSELDYESELRRADTSAPTQLSSLRARVMDIDTRLEELLFGLGRQTPVVKEALELINQKLRIAMQTMPEFQHNQDSLADIPSQECELSADSIVFHSRDGLSVGTKLKLRFFLVSDSRFFETLGYVHRVEPAEDGAAGSQRVIVVFEGMSTAERETLFQHLFSMQSETLRLRRISAEEEA